MIFNPHDGELHEAVPLGDRMRGVPRRRYGRPVLRAPDGERELAPGDVVHFPEGEPGTHQLRNDSDEPFRVLIGSTKSPLNVAGYPDSGKILIDLPGRRRMLRDGPELDYWEGEG
jgi:uncharacterized cupin superfamily protein